MKGGIVMANLKNWILKMTEGKEIEGIVIGDLGWGDDERDEVPVEMKERVLDWPTAEKFLDYEFDSGYGSPGCNAVTVWTKDNVIFISQYDGSTCPCSVPRNPRDHKPEMPGG